MRYYFKANQEAIWFVLVAAGTVILQALATLDVDKITDWRAWVIGLGAAALRAAAGAAISLVNKPPQTRLPDPTDTGLLTVEQVQQVADDLERRMRAQADDERRAEGRG